MIDVGSQLGAYEITALIGEGGMGTVFRARDTRLERDVAIKVLRSDLSSDADRVARFRREAHALAALNHPHIAGIHDVLESEGSQFLVLELVDGQTLDDRLRGGPLPAGEAIGIAIQIADALEAAHARGIVHRDLKPANIKITSSGRVKVLDFGLALDLVPAPAGSGSAATILADGRTEPGMVLGTAGYMSPEQARGQRVDARADVWALGCVLYELLTGRQTFGGKTTADLLAAVVRADPDWSALPPETAPGLRSLLRRCLQKDVTRRVQQVADVRLELEDLQANPQPSSEIRRGRSRMPVRWAWGVMLGVAAVAGFASRGMAVRTAATPPEMRVDIQTPPNSDPTSLAISPDGQKLAFISAADGVSRVWIRSLDNTTAQSLTGTDQARAPFWSPDSRSLGFFADGKLKRIDLQGGLVRSLAGAPIGVGGAWSPKGVIIYSPTALGGLLKVPAGGGEPVPLTRLGSPQQASHRHPRFLPDGRRFLFYVGGVVSGAGGIYTASLDDPAPVRLVDSDSAGEVTSSGHLLYVRQGTLLAQSLTADRRQLSGEPFAIASGIAFDASDSLAGITASTVGSLAYRTGGSSGQQQLVWFNRSGQRLRTVGPPDTASPLNPELSPDGRSVVLNRTVDLNQDIWQLETERGLLRRVTFNAGSEQLAVWSADGKDIVFGWMRRDAYDLFRKPGGGPGDATLLLESSQNKFPMGFSADGRFLLYRLTGENTNWDLWVLPLEGDRKPLPVVQSPFQELMGEFSPDGHWIAYQSNESGQFEIYVQPFPGPGPRTQVSISGGSQPRWRRDGSELFYIALDSRLMAAPVSKPVTGVFQTGPPVPLFVARTAGGPVPSPQKQQYAVGSDGQSFLINSLTEESVAAPITLILNWTPPTAR